MKVERVKIETLLSDPSNARKHSTININALKASLTKFGQQKPIVVDSKNIVIAGNGFLRAAIELGWDKVDIVRTHLDSIDATAYAIADNRTGELAEWDGSALVESLKKLKEINALEATGFSELELEALISKGLDNDPEKLWDGMPEFSQDDKTGYRKIIVTFKNAEDVRKFSELVEQNITDKTKSIWYPRAEIEKYIDKTYVSEP